ncbi:hypothetical protein D9757_013291 [Collybiopsis confluens]|uniref:GATA-type domain-containing protein n=1 Tax=Collybiopsis confluens TaxID=2823264 RepID=A0A8H5G618_9AGAR|nr:hypothetical protein D9757_013291 [Collybiopsis confluens]
MDYAMYSSYPRPHRAFRSNDGVSNPRYTVSENHWSPESWSYMPLPPPYSNESQIPSRYWSNEFTVSPSAPRGPTFYGAPVRSTKFYHRPGESGMDSWSSPQLSPDFSSQWSESDVSETLTPPWNDLLLPNVEYYKSLEPRSSVYHPSYYWQPSVISASPSPPLAPACPTVKSKPPGRRPAVHATPKTCSHCHATSTPLWRRDSLTRRTLCNACGLYLQQRNKLRPQELIDADFDDESAESEHDSSGPECSHCHTRKTSVWRRSKTGAQLCNACGVYIRLRGKERPLSLKRNKIKPRTKHAKPLT